MQAFREADIIDLVSEETVFFRDWKLIGMQPGGWYLFLVKDGKPEDRLVAVYDANSRVLYWGLKLESVKAHDPYWREPTAEDEAALLR